MKANKILESVGAKTSLIMGLRAGIVAMLFYALLTVVVTDESFYIILFLFVNGYATLGLLIAFAITLWFAGIMMEKDILSNKKPLWVISKYSMLVNLVIWSVFILIHFLTNGKIDTYFGLVIPFELALISILFTPFTVGRWIYERIKMKIASI